MKNIKWEFIAINGENTNTTLLQKLNGNLKFFNNNYLVILEDILNFTIDSSYTIKVTFTNIYGN